MIEVFKKLSIFHFNYSPTKQKYCRHKIYQEKTMNDQFILGYPIQ